MKLTFVKQVRIYRMFYKILPQSTRVYSRDFTSRQYIRIRNPGQRQYSLLFVCYFLFDNLQSLLRTVGNQGLKTVANTWNKPKMSFRYVNVDSTCWMLAFSMTVRYCDGVKFTKQLLAVLHGLFIIVECCVLDPPKVAHFFGGSDIECSQLEN